MNTNGGREEEEDAVGPEDEDGKERSSCTFTLLQISTHAYDTSSAFAVLHIAEEVSSSLWLKIKLFVLGIDSAISLSMRSVFGRMGTSISYVILRRR